MPILPSLPIVGHFDTAISSRMSRQIALLVRRLKRDEPALSSTSMFADRVSAGVERVPSVLLGDPGGSGLWTVPGDWALEYRALLLAADGDAVVLETERRPVFESYVRDTLGFGEPELLLLRATSPVQPLAKRCALDAGVRTSLAQIARIHGGLNVIPYVGNGAAWFLGAALARESGVRIHVAAPPPRLSRRANDKLWFARRVRELLGRGSIPRTYSVFGPAALAGRVARVAERHDFVAIKVPDGAGGTGNLVMESGPLRPLSAAALRDLLLRLLGRHTWSGGYPLLVSVWECPVVASPSLQLWIPLAEEGAPVVEGIFDQSTVGLDGEFVGAAPSTLPATWMDQLAHEGACLAALLQALGYYGRCSLDAILVGENLGDAILHWVECNGRWGGTSIPMTVVNRLVGDWMKRPFVTVQRAGLELPRRPFEWLLDALHDDLFGVEHDEAGVVLLAPGGFESGSGFHFVALDATIELARQRAECLTCLLLDSSFRP